MCVGIKRTARFGLEPTTAIHSILLMTDASNVVIQKA